MTDYFHACMSAGIYGMLVGIPVGWTLAKFDTYRRRRHR